MVRRRIELAFDDWAVAAKASRDDVLLHARRGQIEFGQILESTPSRSKPCYPCRDADAGSVPCSTTNIEAPTVSCAHALLAMVATIIKIALRLSAKLPPPHIPGDRCPSDDSSHGLSLSLIHI